jgi:glutamyl-Q tRNA(Asp) synthetase
LVSSTPQSDLNIYKGRFAPSPSGPLHFGSLVAALGSYLQAKKHNGFWYVRIEDIDKPREQPGAVDTILNGLEAFGMEWDPFPNASCRGCLVQTERLSRYTDVMEKLASQDLIYACTCTRKQIKQQGALYTGVCRKQQHTLQNAAIRLKAPDTAYEFIDQHYQKVTIDPEFCHEDYIIKRRDGLFAYQLVVVVDDIDQGITEVVRGADIMELTTRQQALFNLLESPSPKFTHLPLASSKKGFKLSKQNHAPAINIENPQAELIDALTFLGLPTEKERHFNSATVPQIISWAIEHWDLKLLPQEKEVVI